MMSNSKTRLLLRVNNSATQHCRPAPFVLSSRLNDSAQLGGCDQRPVWVSEEFAREEHDVRLPVLKDALGLLGLGDQTDRPDWQVGEGLLQLMCEGDLIPTPHCINTWIPVEHGSSHLVAGAHRDLLVDPVAAGAAVDQVDTDLLQLASEDLRLLDAPLLPEAVLALLGTLRPVSRAEAHEEGLVPGGADARDEAEGEAQAVLEGLAAVLVGAYIGNGGDELVEEVAMRGMNLDEVN